jgi:hypothetical protein
LNYNINPLVQESEVVCLSDDDWCGRLVSSS